MQLEQRTDLGEHVFGLHGTPADAALVALDPAHGVLPNLGLAPILLVSGPNYGYNISGDIVYSGTVSAARQAAYMGVPAVAASFKNRTPADYKLAVEATA